MGLTPAHAGSTEKFNDLLGGDGAHPRACGEHCWPGGGGGAGEGSPPRMRGARMWASACKSLGGAHPRACGEHLTGPVGLAAGVGSPPRMRGAHSQKARVFVRIGLTPAHAGSTLADKVLYQQINHIQSCPFRITPHGSPRRSPCCLETRASMRGRFCIAPNQQCRRVRVQLPIRGQAQHQHLSRTYHWQARATNDMPADPLIETGNESRTAFPPADVSSKLRHAARVQLLPRSCRPQSGGRTRADRDRGRSEVSGPHPSPTAPRMRGTLFATSLVATKRWLTPSEGNLSPPRIGEGSERL